MGSPLDQAENAGALRYLAHGRPPAEAAIRPPNSDVDRQHLGTHPDVADRLWDVLNGALPADSRTLVFEGPALIHPGGVILAAVIGTQYALRLLPDDLTAAIAAGAEVIHHFRTVGTTLDLPATFGPEWAFGRFDDREPAWLLATYRAVDASSL